MTSRAPFKRLILRAVLRNISPMVIRVVALPDYLDLRDLDDVFRAILGWDGLGYIFRVHGQEFNSFRRRTQSKMLRGFQLRPQEKLLYTCGAIDLWDGSVGFWTKKRESQAMTRRSVWAAEVRLLQSTAGLSEAKRRPLIIACDVPTKWRGSVHGVTTGFCR